MSRSDLEHGHAGVELRAITGDHRGAPLLEGELAAFGFERTNDALILHTVATYYADQGPIEPAGHHPNLWQHEVIEVFIAGPKSQYLEIELGPHGHYWVLDFHDVRQVRGEHTQLRWICSHEGPTWRARVTIPWRWLPAGQLRFNAFAIHDGKEPLQGARRFLALVPHAASKPDFHVLDCFEPLGFANPHVVE